MSLDSDAVDVDLLQVGASRAAPAAGMDPVTEECDGLFQPMPIVAPAGVSQAAWNARLRHEVELSEGRRVIVRRRREHTPVPSAKVRPRKTPPARPSIRSRAPSRPSTARAAPATSPPSEGPPDPPRATGAVSLQAGSRGSQDGKLCRVERQRVVRKDGAIGLKLVNCGPRTDSCYVAMAPTCPAACPRLQSGDCYPVASGPATRNRIKRLNAAAVGHSSTEVIEELVAKLDASHPRGVPQDGPRGGGRPLRLMVAGDVRTEAEASRLGEAVTRRRVRGGGTGWGYTHSWRDIDREAFGPDISPLASVDSIDEIGQAYEQGYASALTVAKFPDAKPYRVPGMPWRFLPCPNEVKKNALDIKRVTSGMSGEEHENERRKVPTCMACGLCLDAGGRFAKREVIVFQEHGPAQAQARNRRLRAPSQLVQLRAKTVAGGSEGRFSLRKPAVADPGPSGGRS